jgi:cysteine desulfurase
MGYGRFMPSDRAPIYFDYNASAPLRAQVAEACLPFFAARHGNPSSIHASGRALRAAIDEARECVAAFVGCAPREVTFVSGGSEADNLAIKGAAEHSRAKGNHIVTTKVEHPAVLNACRDLIERGFEVTFLDVDAGGRLDLAQLEAALRADTILISAMAANNETGVTFPIAAIGDIAHRHGILFHTDAVQGAGRMKLDMRADRIDLISLSGHKLGAPMGAGALVVRGGAKIHPQIHGGLQEFGRRAGTENTAAIAGLGAACAYLRKSMTEEIRATGALRDRLERGLQAARPFAKVIGDTEHRLANTSLMAFAGAAADSLLANLDMAGIAVSSGAACASGTVRPSHVLAAMGLPPELAKCVLRFSLGPENTAAEVDRVLEVLPPLAERLRKS